MSRSKRRKKWIQSGLDVSLHTCNFVGIHLEMTQVHSSNAIYSPHTNTSLAHDEPKTPIGWTKLAQKFSIWSKEVTGSIAIPHSPWISHSRRERKKMNDLNWHFTRLKWHILNWMNEFWCDYLITSNYWISHSVWSMRMIFFSLSHSDYFKWMSDDL